MIGHCGMGIWQLKWLRDRRQSIVKPAIFKLGIPNYLRNMYKDCLVMGRGYPNTAVNWWAFQKNRGKAKPYHSLPVRNRQQ